MAIRCHYLICKNASDLAEGGHLDAVLVELLAHGTDFLICIENNVHLYMLSCETSVPSIVLCPVHTIPRQDVNRKKFAQSDVYDTCDLWRAGVDGIANLISQRLAIF